PPDAPALHSEGMTPWQPPSPAMPAPHPPARIVPLHAVAGEPAAENTADQRATRRRVRRVPDGSTDGYGEDASRPGPYTPVDLAAMPEDGQRYELVDGALLVSWSRTLLHQRAAGRLCSVLNAAGASGLEAVGAVEVRCGPDTVLVPDVVVLVSSVVDEPDCVVTADHVALVAEVASPSSVRMDRVLRPRLYADAGIPAYLLVELEGPTLTWFALSGPGGYQRRRVAAGDAELRVTVKLFEMRIVPAELVRRARRQQ